MANLRAAEREVWAVPNESRRARDLVDIFRHRWDPIILVLLAEQPRRRRELTQEVRHNRGEHISDGVLSKALDRLQYEGLITKEQRHAKHVVYRATPMALGRVEWLQCVSEFAATTKTETAHR